MEETFTAYTLGATLYMPITHHNVPRYMRGEVAFPAPSVVLCLEDAVHQDDVSTGLQTLAQVLADRSKQGQPKPLSARVFIRPRSMDMAYDLADFEGISKVEGFVAPKITVETAPGWMALAQQSGLGIMPTIETPDFFDPGQLLALKEIIADYGAQHIAAIRIGGNDLLGAMALRRQAGVTAWEGPLSWILSMVSSLMISASYPVAAPVYDVFDDIETLKREVAQDVAAGFVSKTAIHPVQVPHIMAAFQVQPRELTQAQAILNPDGKAVFQMDGVMCEPSTHFRWAQRIMARHQYFGCYGRDAAWGVEERLA